jgi:hypothetical protein
MPSGLRPLAHQTIVIPGASSGMGLVTARMAARRGAAVVPVEMLGVGALAFVLSRKSGRTPYDKLGPNEPVAPVVGSGARA